MKSKNKDRKERQGVGIATTAFEGIGFAFREQPISDFGIDAHAEFIDEERPTGQLLGIQLKSGPSWLKEKNDKGYVFRVDAKHIEYWLDHSLPVIIALCDVEQTILYWEYISEETVVSTGKGFKITTPFDQKVDESSAVKLRSLTTPLVSEQSYTVFQMSDTSHAAAKRYSLDIVINRSLSKAEIASVIRCSTEHHIPRRYYRNDITANRWGDAKADVLFSFVYLSAEDRARTNWICRGLWIRDDLPMEFAPMRFDGENIGGAIIVEWKTNYLEMARFINTHTSRKEDYLGLAVPLLKKVHELCAELGNNLVTLESGDVSEEGFLGATFTIRQEIEEIYRSSQELGFPPFECTDFQEKLASYVSLLDNACLPFTPRGLKTWNEAVRLRMALRYLKKCQSDYPFVQYELKKIL